MTFRSLLLADLADLAPALDSEADAILIDLARNEAPPAEVRAAAASARDRIHEAGKLAVARINHGRTRLAHEDLEALVAPSLAAVVLTDTGDPQEVRDAGVSLREFEYSRGIEPGEIDLFPTIASARGLVRAADIAAAAHRVAGLVFDSDAYSRDIGARIEESGPRLAFARGQVVAVARAVDGAPLIAGNSHHLADASRYGFAGAIVLAGRVARVANDVFTPSLEARTRARRHLDAYADARANGDWVARVEGEIVGRHNARKAERLLRYPEPPVS